MLTRRILACACALALAIPAAAGARAGFDPPPTTHHTVYGDTKYDLQNQQDMGSPKGEIAKAYVPPTNTAVALKGDTKNDIEPSYADRVGSLSPAQLAAAYGTTQPKGTPIASAPDVSARHVVLPAGKSVGGRVVTVNLHKHHGSALASSDEGVNGWQLAAVIEAALLAAIALGAAAFVARMRPRGTAHA
jgi:hypothetical protein